MRRRFAAAMAALVLVVVVCFVSGSFRSLQISYHRWRFNVAHEYMYNGPTQIDSSGFQYTDTTDVLPVHEYHKQRLVELKAIAYFQYRFKNIANDSAQRRLLIDLMLTGKCPPAVDWTSPHINYANPVVVDLWCELEFKDDWEAFFARQNSLAAKASP